MHDYSPVHWSICRYAYGCETAVVGIHIGPDEGERIPRGSRHHRVLAELPEVEVVDARFGPGFSVARHRHEEHVDSFYILEGEAEFTVGDEVFRAVPGTWVSVPTGVAHGFRNARDAELRILNVHTPNTGFVERLRAARVTT
jgi:quercetin dioxygenase-like cupin family protein